MIKKLIINRALFVVVLFLTVQVVIAQGTGKPRVLVVKGDYTHSRTKKTFPKHLARHERQRIYSFDRDKSNIGATYKSQDGKTLVSVYLYPADEGSEDRLRHEYMSALGEILLVSRKGITTSQAPTTYVRDGYKINGIKAEVTDVKNQSRSHLAVFECGEWFFKLRVTSSSLDSIGVVKLERDILDAFEPSELVKQSRLNPEASIYLAPAAFADSLMLVSAMGGAFKKVQWARENVDSLERAAGFPSLYLELHVESLKEFARQEKVREEIRKKWTRQPSTDEFLFELNSIIESGYLREFIMDQYNMIMIVPDDAKLDFESYRQWMLADPISIKLDRRFYVISYENEK